MPCQCATRAHAADELRRAAEAVIQREPDRAQMIAELVYELLAAAEGDVALAVSVARVVAAERRP